MSEASRTQKVLRELFILIRANAEKFKKVGLARRLFLLMILIILTPFVSLKVSG